MSEKKTLNSTLIENVLNYWYSFDFLGQSALQTELSRQEKESLEYALNNEGQRQTHSIICRDSLLEGESIQEKTELLVKERHMNCVGNITVNLGSISRNYCIEEIIRIVGEVEQHEVSLSKIALACLQIGPNGEYIPNSFSLSPVLWSLNRITSTASRQQPQGWLSKIEYDKENRSFEEIISQMSMSTYEDLLKITQIIIEKYVSSDAVENNSELCEEINLNYRMYKNEDEREKREGDYYGLTMDFYADDLEMVLSQVEDLKNKGRIPSTLGSLMFYIQSAFDMQKDLDIHRHDLIGEREDVDKEKQFNELKEILDIRRAPLGKWPSRYMPFLMQQIAINLAIDEKHEKGTAFADNGTIFSINGAPGTGKTTLIKEIIANNVVNRAILMAKYIKNPDDIFETCSFKHGPDPITHAYAKFNKNYYRIRPEYQRIASYAIVVASNNNAAVDNITVEIPDLKSLLDNLQSQEGDSEDLRRGLEEIRYLFDPNNGKKEEKRVTDFEKKTSEWQEYNDLYFSSYADKLYSEDRKTWGLISVPLGRKGNLNRFYKKVLNEMAFGPFYSSKKENRGLRPDERKISYANAVKAFLTQLKKVENMRDEIAYYIDNAPDPKAEHKKNIELIDSFASEQIKLEKEIIDMQKQEENLRNAVRSLEDNRSVLNQTIQKINIELDQIKKEQEEIELVIFSIKEEIKVENEELHSLSIFQGKRKTELKGILDNNYAIFSSKQDMLAVIVQKRSDKAAEYSAVFEERENLDSTLQRIASKLEQLEKDIKKAYKKKDEIAICKKDAEKALLDAEIQMNTQSDQYHGEGVDQFRVFSMEYYNALHSSDAKESVEAHTGNPWFTERYNREREKLFYYAMLLNKEFVLASSCIRSNISHLGMAWHIEVRPGQYYGDEAVYFHKEDLEDCMPSLLQSLQFMVPVISTTFASIGNFFRYVKAPGSIGTLIIDEAGQAAPQTAVGALWRANKAIVIGDPKQIEPVVTDDVSLLKTAYGDDVYRCYAEKTLSVQGFADYLNCYGTKLFESEDDTEGQWIGSPLTVHRRCVSPMYEISNHLSYANTMKQVTPEPSDEISATLSLDKTKWINVSGKENGKGDHFVAEQGDCVLRLLDNAFKVFFTNSPDADQSTSVEISLEEDRASEFTCENGPDLFIISPFNTVIEGMKQHLVNNLNNPNYPALSTHAVQVEDWLTDWRNVHIGTVHKFQGREANEVILLLGCDMSSVKSTKWVKKNIVNVAVSRAKYRLVVIGDAEVWNECQPMMVAKEKIDAFKDME